VADGLAKKDAEQDGASECAAEHTSRMRTHKWWMGDEDRHGAISSLLLLTH
jgi:hypothetical protein